MAAGKFVVPGSPSSGGGINYTVDVFTSSGTYTKPVDLDYCYVLMVSGGSGGGSGRIGAASTNRGGGFGTNGQMVLSKFNNADLSATESVTVGTGGSGAASQTLNNTNGIAGSSGGATNFKYGSTFQINGGSSVAGGTSILSSSTQSPQKNLTSNRTRCLNFFINAVSLGTTAASNDFRGNSVSNFSTVESGSPFHPTSAGGQIRSTNVRENAGALCGYYDDSVTLIDEIAGTAPEANGVQPTQFYTFGQWLNKLFPWFDPADANYNVGRGGLGGGCGDLAGTIPGGNGADGLGYGAGGGGGGASTNGANSGAGGNGTGGIVIIINVLTS